MATGLLLAGLAACGDDDGDDAAADDAAGSEAAGLAGDGGSADAEEFCGAAVDVDAALLAADSEEAAPEDAAGVEDAMGAASEAAPEQVADAVDTMISESRAMMAEAEATAEQQGPPPIPSDDFFAASVEVGDFLADNCDLEVLDVTAENYAFSGFPETVPAGTAMVRLTNEGTEFHEAVVVKIADGEDRPLEELLTLPDEEIQPLVTDEAFAFVPPGQETYVTADLDPGRYVAVCFVPVGATPEALSSGEMLEEAEPHAMHGMVAEFQVA